MNVPTHDTITISRDEKSDTQLFFSYKKLLRVLRHQLKILKSTLNRGLAYTRDSCTHESLGYQYELQKLLNEKRRRTTSKYHEYTETKVSGYIAVVFVTKKSFSVLTTHVFSATLDVCTITHTCK